MFKKHLFHNKAFPFGNNSIRPSVSIAQICALLLSISKWRTSQWQDFSDHHMWQFSNNAKFIAVNVNATRRCLFCDTSQHICIGMKVTWRAFFEMTHWIEGRGDERINDLTLFCHWPPAILWSAPRPSHFYSFSLFFWNINKNKRNFHSKKKKGKRQ